MLETTPATLAELLHGDADIDDVVTSGRVRLTGAKREARRFVEMFPMARRPAAAG
ncbi:MAG: hypothetical protein ACRD0A_09610 [Acidimicrobiales bacterium]